MKDNNKRLINKIIQSQQHHKIKNYKIKTENFI